MSQNQEEEKDKEALSYSDYPLPVAGMPNATYVHQESNIDNRPSTMEAQSTELPPSSPLSSSRRASPKKSPAKLRKTPSQQSLSSNAPMLQVNKRTSMSSLRGIGNQTPPRSPVSSGRRSSTGLFSGLLTKQTSDAPPRIVQTPSSVAKEYLRKDLDSHISIEAVDLPDTAVVFHDACYGHRFSRPRTSKANLNTIVERPERILAIVTGVSAAYVLLGDRHLAGTNSPSPTAIPGSPPFIIHKSTRSVDITSSAVTNVHGMKWMSELKEMCNAAESRLTQNGKELVRPKDNSSGANQDKPTLHEGDLYLCAESLAAFEGALGGVLDAVDVAFKPGSPNRVFACVRPPGHHCSDDYPSGFCWLNNVHVGISHAAMEHGLTHAAIFDFDLHHGDGSQSITWAHNSRAISLPKNAHISKKTSIGYYSLHDINSYPCEWGDEDKVRNASLCIENAHGQSIWNVHLQPWTTDEDFWKLYEDRYMVLITKMRVFLRTQNERFRSMGVAVRSKGAIFISAGFDASEWEGHGMQRHSVNVPTEFYARITRDIVKLSEEDGLGVDGRVISVLEGGYSDRALASGVLSHLCGLASSPIAKPSPSSQSASGHPSAGNPVRYDTDWWSPVRLEELDARAKSADANLSSVKIRAAPTSSYHSPTQSFAAKVVSPPTYQRSVANSLSRQTSASYERARTPTPPPPEVDWATAAYELSQLIIPQDRQTRSCNFADLNAKATEARKSRQSTIGPTVVDRPEESLDLEKMNLRDRQAKAPQAALDTTRTTSRTASNRRKTFGGTEVLEKQLVRQPSRRLSVASADLSIVDSTPTALPPMSDPAQVPKVRAAPKPRAPRKTASKPSTPRATTSSRKLAGASTRESSSAPDGAMDEIVSGMKNIRLKLNPPTKPVKASVDTNKPTAQKEVKGVVRAPRKPPVKKTVGKETVTKPEVKSSLPAGVAFQSSRARRSSSGDFASMPSASSQAPGQSSTSQNKTGVTPYEKTHVDAMMFSKAPFDPALSDYLSLEASTANAVSPELPIKADADLDTQPFTTKPQSSSSTVSETLVIKSDPFGATSTDTPVEHKIPTTPSQYHNNNNHNLPTFTANGHIPFATKIATNDESKLTDQPVGQDLPVQAQPSKTNLAIIAQSFDTTMQDYPIDDVDNGFGPDHGYNADHNSQSVFASTAAADVSIDLDLDSPAYGYPVIKEEGKQ